MTMILCSKADYTNPQILQRLERRLQHFGESTGTKRGCSDLWNQDDIKYTTEVRFISAMVAYRPIALIYLPLCLCIS
jgi:hypothetical protein